MTTAHMMSVSTQVPIYLHHSHHLASTMDQIYYYWTTSLLLLVSTTLASYSPSSGDLDPRNKMTRVSMMLTLLKAWMVLSIMNTLDATMTSLTTKIVGVLFWIYLHLQEIPPPLFKHIVDYGKHIKYGSSTWIPPGKCNTQNVT